jgi:F-type H+-transporting ATPase subunit a
MINNLFSIFDPIALFNLPLNWVRIIIFILVIRPCYWVFSNPSNTIFKKIIRTINNEFSTLLKGRKINIILFVRIFSLILVNNTVGLLSFTFTATRHLAITLSLALPLWVRFIIYRVINNLTNFLAHLVPNGTPPVLMPFIVVIEIVRNVIRPITLSVRLAANIIAGHLLLTLLGNQVVRRSWIVFPLICGPEYLLIVLESAVACIQAYVFSVLTTLYASEA